MKHNAKTSENQDEKKTKKKQKKKHIINQLSKNT